MVFFFKEIILKKKRNGTIKQNNDIKKNKWYINKKNGIYKKMVYT